MYATATYRLCPGGQVEAVEAVRLIFVKLACERRTGSDDTHTGTQNIEQPRQLIHRILVERTARNGSAGSVGDLEQHSIAIVQLHQLGAPLLRVPNLGVELGNLSATRPLLRKSLCAAGLLNP